MAITALDDRKALKWTIPYYKRMAEAVSQNCFLDKEENFCKISKAKKKKLKNLRYQILKDPVKSQSPIHLEIVRRCTVQIRKHERRPIQ